MRKDWESYTDESGKLRYRKKAKPAIYQLKQWQWGVKNGKHTCHQVQFQLVKDREIRICACEHCDTDITDRHHKTLYCSSECQESATWLRGLLS